MHPFSQEQKAYICHQIQPSDQNLTGMEMPRIWNASRTACIGAGPSFFLGAILCLFCCVLVRLFLMGIMCHRGQAQQPLSM